MARGAGGALLFSLPMLMTMEIWWFGFSADRSRLVIFLALGVPLLIGLSHYSGLRPTTGWLGDAADGLSAYGIGLVVSAVVLSIFGVVDSSEAWRDVIGKISLEAVPAALGAALAQSQFGQKSGKGSGGSSGGSDPKQQREDNVGYWGQLFLMACGALYLSLSVSPTLETVLIAYKMDPWRSVVLALLSLLVLHAFVYALDFRGEEPSRPGTAPWSLFLRFSVVGYALALVLSGYVLWTFGRFEGTGSVAIVSECIVLGFPAAIGAAAARLVL